MQVYQIQYFRKYGGTYFSFQHRLGNYPEKVFTDDRSLSALRKFKNKLNEITDIIVRRNESLELPYTALLPKNIRMGIRSWINLEWFLSAWTYFSCIESMTSGAWFFPGLLVSIKPNSMCRDFSKFKHHSFSENKYDQIISKEKKFHWVHLAWIFSIFRNRPWMCAL